MLKRRWSMLACAVALTAGVVAMVSHPAGAAASLVAAYNFDEGTGATLQDRSGNGNHGTLVSNPAWVPQGKYGGALSFDGLTTTSRSRMCRCSMRGAANSR